MARMGLVLTPLVAQYLIHISLPLALLTYAAICILCVICLRLLPLETVGRQMPSTTEGLLHTLRSSSGGGFASDPRAHWFWRKLRWTAAVDGTDVIADAQEAAQRRKERSKGIVKVADPASSSSGSSPGGGGGGGGGGGDSAAP